MKGFFPLTSTLTKKENRAGRLEPFISLLDPRDQSMAILACPDEPEQGSEIAKSEVKPSISKELPQRALSVLSNRLFAKVQRPSNSRHAKSVKLPFQSAYKEVEINRIT